MTKAARVEDRAGEACGAARRANRGTECPQCGSVEVVVTTTRKRVVPLEDGEDQAWIVRRYLQCRRCGDRWPARERVSVKRL